MMPVVIILLGGVISGLLLILFTVFLCKVCRCTCHQLSIDGSSIDSKFINCSRDISSTNLEGLGYSVSGLSHETTQNNTSSIINSSPVQTNCDTSVSCKPRQFNTSFSVNKPSFADVVLAISKRKRQVNRTKGFRSALSTQRSPHISKLRSSSYNAVCHPITTSFKTDSIESKSSSRSFLFPPGVTLKSSVSKSFDLENYKNNCKSLIHQEPIMSLDLESGLSSDHIETLFSAKTKSTKHKPDSDFNETDILMPNERSRTHLKHVTKLNTWTLSQDTSFESDDSNEKTIGLSQQSSPFSVKINDSGYRSVNQSSSPTNGYFDFSLTIPDYGNSRSLSIMKQRTASCKRKSFSKQKASR